MFQFPCTFLDLSPCFTAPFDWFPTNWSLYCLAVHSSFFDGCSISIGCPFSSIASRMMSLLFVHSILPLQFMLTTFSSLAVFFSSLHTKQGLMRDCEDHACNACHLINELVSQSRGLALGGTKLPGAEVTKLGSSSSFCIIVMLVGVAPRVCWDLGEKPHGSVSWPLWRRELFPGITPISNSAGRQ